MYNNQLHRYLTFGNTNLKTFNVRTGTLFFLNFYDKYEQ